jgi:hypothetical protein
MLLAIAILLGIDILGNLIIKKDMPMLSYSALVIVLWHLLFPLAIIVLVIGVILILIMGFE